MRTRFLRISAWRSMDVLWIVLVVETCSPTRTEWADCEISPTRGTSELLLNFPEKDSFLTEERLHTRKEPHGCAALLHILARACSLFNYSLSQLVLSMRRRLLRIRQKGVTRNNSLLGTHATMRTRICKKERSYLIGSFSSCILSILSDMQSADFFSNNLDKTKSWAERTPY